MKRSVLIFVCVCALFLLFSGVLVFAQNHMSVSKNFPKNTFINGVDCSNLDFEEAEELLIKEWENREFVITQDNEEIGNIKDFNFEYDIEDPLNEALLHSAVNPLYTHVKKQQNNLFVPMNISRISDSFKKQFSRLDMLHQNNVTKTKNAYVDMSDNDFDIVKEVYGNKWQYEIDRLTYLKQFNPSIREDEIARLQKLQKEGLSLLDGLSVTPEAIQVMVVVKP